MSKYKSDVEFPSEWMEKIEMLKPKTPKINWGPIDSFIVQLYDKETDKMKYSVRKIYDIIKDDNEHLSLNALRNRVYDIKRNIR